MIAAILLCLAPVAIDGDTVRCSTGQQVRLFGIDAPEPGERGYSASAISLQQLVRGGIQCIHKGNDLSIAAICLNAAGEDVGEQQIRRGMARVWR